MTKRAGVMCRWLSFQSTNSVRYYTDSAGLAAFDEPGLMNRKVFFGVAALGYEFRPGLIWNSRRGPGAKTGRKAAELKIKRINIAERIYRITGAGILSYSVLSWARRLQSTNPLLNGEITGQDGVFDRPLPRQALLVLWRYGATSVYALGNFAMAGATTDLPDKLDPSARFEPR